LIGWESDEHHVVPIDDLKPHSTDSDKPCWCNPTDWIDVLVHNSMDRRELYEMGILKLS
jgi:hypothetical protein